MGPAIGKASQSIRGRVIATTKIRSDYLISLQRASSNRLCPLEEKSVFIAKMICLETLLKHQCSEDLLLGELQFAFIAFLMAQSLEAFLQWKSLLSLLFGCTEATRKFKELLENSLGWEFQQSSAVDGLYFDENDEVIVRKWDQQEERLVKVSEEEGSPQNSIEYVLIFV
ncbi:unnamed protein product [Trifolium pratense]|uniref:Uncharacterized protein n=1 Tax=Trifolium pratense TaxID=57577 RepID=A0ACB0K9G1_TRIPR|nr:unnamed protein product [Trifolium pratense]